MGLVGADYISPQYQASKGAVRILTKSVAIQYASDNIRCNSIHPAPIETDMPADIRNDADSFQNMLRRIPMASYASDKSLIFSKNDNINIFINVERGTEKSKPFNNRFSEHYILVNDELVLQKEYKNRFFSNF